MATRKPIVSTSRRTLGQSSGLVSSTSSSSAASATTASSSKQQQQQHARQLSADPQQQQHAKATANGSSNVHRQPRMSYRPRDAEGNINVVVRCRSRSAQEVNSSAPMTTAVKSLRGTAVTLTNPALAPPPTALSTATPISRTYDFGSRPQEGKEGLGNVFGPDADQVMIYNDVARPILDEVLRGYNCTIFAYGQTGTGKTYTMEGDLSLARGISTSAGIIPRTLYSLFAKLAEDKSDFSVRCSFVELYNEELRDLNALEYSEPGFNIASDTKSGPGNAASAPAAATGLRIYDDKVTGSGVIIQGLEETLITSAEEGLKVLKRGSERRQSASTNCNEHSSRSHSIFTITIHIKEPSKTGGEDLLKVGKLNLVDLAGSENIGRSGAVQGRAREAGMINTSLLTLGRVINKLVEKQSHIPYRESKLTRLLQDSLGGRTKTTIIATISPVNFDETASTLDYALRAKKIENRPEINQRMTKNVLLGQYATEIERLKQDLVCAREKNGIFISSETWSEMNADQDARRVQLEETKRLLEVNDAQLATARDQFEQAMRMLGTREEELVKANQDIEAHRDEIRKMLMDLADVQRNLDQETVLREAFEESRKAWQNTAGDAISDVAGLRAKIARKSSVERSNLRTLETATSTISSVTSNLNSSLDTFNRSQLEHVTRGHASLVALSQDHEAQLRAFSAEVEQQLASTQSNRHSVVTNVESLSERIALFNDVIETMRAGLLEELSSKSKETAAEQRKQAEAIVARLMSHAEQTAQVLRTIVEPVQMAQAQIIGLLQQNKQALAELKTADDKVLKDENARLLEIVAGLQAELEQERSRNVSEDAELVALLQSRLKDRSEQRAERLEKSVAVISTSVNAGIESRMVGQKQRDAAFEGVQAREDDTVTALSSGFSKMATQSEADQLSLSSSLQEMMNQLQRNDAAMQSGFTTQIEFVERTCADVSKASAQFRDDAAKATTLLIDDVDGMLAGAKTGAAQSRSRMQNLSARVESSVDEIRQTLNDVAGASNSLSARNSEHLSDLQGHVSNYLSRDIKIDLPTGQTPRKRAWPGDRLGSIVNLDDPARSTVVDKLLEVKELHGGLDRALEANPVGLDDGEVSTEMENSVIDGDVRVEHTLQSNHVDEDALDVQREGAETDYASPTPPSARSLTPVEVDTAVSLPTPTVSAAVHLKKGSHDSSAVALDERDHNLKTKTARMR
ncbi:hypothetical protein ACM66B_002142 [Microbotryomycetes sp. NB124-2]